MGNLTEIKEIFSNVYRTNEWGSGSGDGSKLEAVGDYIRVLTEIIKTYNIKSVLDYGCGDWQFSKHIDWENLVDSYIGVDVVDDLIQHHTKTYTSQKITFQPITSDWVMPKVDLIICKDVLQHLPNNTVEELLASFESSAKYMILTNDSNIDSSIPLQDCTAGSWRPLNLNSQPWNKPSTVLLKWYRLPQYNTIKDTLFIENP